MQFQFSTVDNDNYPALNNLKIFRPKVTKNLTNLLNKFCEFQQLDHRENYFYEDFFFEK